MKTEKPIRSKTPTDEVRKKTEDIFTNYQNSKLEKMVKIIDELTPKVKQGVIRYVDGFITYTSGWSDKDSEKKEKILNLKVIKEFLINPQLK